MPTPVGHAIGGLAAAFLTNVAARRPRLTIPVLLAAMGLAISPDLDILAGSHRTYTHSIGAVAAVGLISWAVLRSRHVDAVALAASLAAAYGSHLVYDLMGKDSRAPVGLTALWPLSNAFYTSGWDLFGEVSRRYWLPSEFILGNLRAVAWEVAVLAPLLVMAWAWWSRRTLQVGRRKSEVVRR